MRPHLVAIDTGGTFTDLVARDDAGKLVRLKTPSTPDDPSRAIRNALTELQGAATELRHGTTVGTNALLERRGAEVALILTAGFEDLLSLRRQARPDLFALHPIVPPPLVDPKTTLGIRGRLDAGGEQVEPLANVPTWIEDHRGVLERCSSIAICLLHAYASDQHEAPLARALRSAFPDKSVTVSSELAPLSREYERTSTVAVNAFLAPVMSAYLSRLRERVAPAEVRVMVSGGGLAPAERITREPVHTVLSGPAGGVRAAWTVGRRCGRERLLGLDMGGTSADVSLVLGELEPQDDGHLNEHPLRAPLLPIVTVGAGGGSIAHVDAGGALRVGPRSAGATPGPAAYGNGGQDATVTDANVVLGRLTELLGGAMTIDSDAAHAAVDRIAKELGTERIETAEAIVAIAESTMARACKRVSMERGVDPRTLTLVAFGGAGGLHACALADELGCADVLFPHECGVLSAEGILDAPSQVALSRSVFIAEEDWSDDNLRAALAEVGTAASDQLGRETGRSDAPSLRLRADCRYRGQTFALALDVDAASVTPEGLRGAFDERHRERYGYDLETPVELVAVRAFAESATSAPASDDDVAEAAWSGPRVINSYSATLWLPEGWQAQRLPSGDILCTRRAGTVKHHSHAEALALEVHRQRIAAIAEEMGAALMRASFSANIKERRDFSCAVFDRDGRMLVQAAHIPVHLGSQQMSVRAAIEAGPISDGTSIILNDPYAGGTHLPDVTLVTPVFGSSAEPDAPTHFVANRAHHADVGGIQPGSIPSPFDHDGQRRPLTIDDEGWRSPPVPLTDAVRDDFAQTSRTPDERYGDLRAQEAANHVGHSRLVAMHDELPPHLDAALLDYTERRMRALIRALPDGVFHFEDALDSDGLTDTPVPIPVTLTIAGDEATVDFTGAPAAVKSSLNAVRAITVSAVFYCFRCLGGEEMPSNEGLLRPIQILTKPGTICDALHPAAVSAGNVETSQRLVDAVYGALVQAAPHTVPAASGGTMNNVLFGGTSDLDPTRAFVHYETLAVGAGASGRGHGASAIQTHMTNTLNTPIEELERQYPVRIREYRVRRGSGGEGDYRGGDGVVRAYSFLADANVTLMSERRMLAPWGSGGEPGTMGHNRIERADGRSEALPGKVSVRVFAGDTLVVETPGGGGWSKPS